MITRKVYPISTPTKTYADSIYIERWCARINTKTEEQTTVYRGYKKDLIAVGLAPEEIFKDIGRSGKKTARIVTHNNEEQPISIQRMAKGEWRVERRHNTQKLPYSSGKARCTSENGKVWGTSTLRQRALKSPPIESKEHINNTLNKVIFFGAKKLGIDESSLIEDTSKLSPYIKEQILLTSACISGLYKNHIAQTKNY